MLYLYFRSILNENTGLKKRDLLHLIPMLIFLAGTINYILTPWSFKTHIAKQLVENFNNIQIFDTVLLYKFIPKRIVFFSRPAFLLAYATGAAASLVHFLKKETERQVFHNQRFMFKWLCLILVFVFTLTICQSIIVFEAFSVKDSILFYTINLLQILSGLGLTGLLISPFFFPEILYGLPRIPKPIAVDEKVNRKLDSERKSSKQFETEYMDSIGMRINTFMMEQKPFTNPEFNLAKFAKLLNVPTHHLAFYFKEIKNETFTEYRNKWRINHAVNLIREGNANNLTIEAIALLSGFSTRNTFFTAFKKFKGISPGSYVSKYSKK